MSNLKSIQTPELYSLWSFSKEMLLLWNGKDASVEKYYKTISDNLMDEMNSRIEILYPELTHLIS